MRPIQLIQEIERKFSLDELKALCFDLGIDFDSLPGQAKLGKVQSLVEYVNRRGRLAELLDFLKFIRPEGSWPDSESYFLPTSITAFADYSTRRITIEELKILGCSIRNLSIVLSLVVLYIGGRNFFHYQNSRIPPMAGDFNVVVSEFSTPNGGNVYSSRFSSEVATLLSQSYDALSRFEDVHVMGIEEIISNDEQARELANQINANLVIYWEANENLDGLILTPQLYVVATPHQNLIQINGSISYGVPISIDEETILRNELIKSRYAENAQSFISFTESLVLLASGTPDDLLSAKDKLVRLMEENGKIDPFPGIENTYLLAAILAFPESDFEEVDRLLDAAFSLNPNNARVYLEKGNVHYGQFDLEEAREFYTLALVTNDRPLGAFIDEFASFGLGNICAYEAQIAANLQVRNEAVNCALENYSVIIDTFNQDTLSNLILKNSVAYAYYGSGLMYDVSNNPVDATRNYEKASELTEDASLLERILLRLDHLKE